MPTWKEFKSWIEIEGEEAKEYDVQQTEEEGVAKVICWIASEVGKAFTVNWTDSAVSTATATFVSVDGKKTYDGKIIRLGAINKQRSAEGFRFSDSQIKPLVFSEIRLTDDDQYLESVSKHLGEIVVEIDRCAVGQPDTSKRKRAAGPKDKNIIHERSKKALMSHKVNAGASIDCKGSRVECYILSNVVKFIFRYQSIDQLMASGVAPHPRPEKRSAPAEVIDISDDSDNEILTEVAQLKAKLAVLEAKVARKKIKKEHVDKQEDVKSVIIL